MEASIEVETVRFTDKLLNQSEIFCVFADFACVVCVVCFVCGIRGLGPELIADEPPLSHVIGVSFAVVREKREIN